MYEVRVETDFAAAHFLRDYHGKCERLHGHNYRVFAHVWGERLDAGGMLLDFMQLKSALRTVVGRIDHTNLNEVKYFDQNPSAERIARYLYDELITELRAQFGIDLSYSAERAAAGENFLWAVDVFETDTSRARYRVC